MLDARHVLQLSLLWLAWICAAQTPGVSPQINIYSEDAEDFASGVPFYQWLKHVTIQVPKPTGPLGNPLQLDGGNCSQIRINSLDAQDLTVTDLTPAFSLHISAHLECTLLLSGGSLAIGFAIDNATADLAFLVQPVEAPGSSGLLVPLGKVKVTRCKISIIMSMLRFTGSSPLNEALTQLHPALEQFINEELPEVACSQLEPLIEKQASATLAAMLIQLEPFLRKHPPLPPEPTRSGIPLVDWETYPPAHLLRSLAQRRPAQVASVIQRISTQEIPLKMLGVNRSVAIDAVGTTLRSYMQELRIQGLNSFVAGSLALLGSGQHITGAAAFANLSFAVRLQAQVRSVDPSKMKQATPLLETFEVQLHLGSVTARAEILAMVSQEAVDKMQVDQFQEFDCLVACARSGAALGSEAPVALRRLQILNMTAPTARVLPRGSLDVGLADLCTTLLRVILHGYVPSFEAIIQSSVTMLHDAMNSVVKQVLEVQPPCEPA